MKGLIPKTKESSPKRNMQNTFYNSYAKRNMRKMTPQLSNDSIQRLKEPKDIDDPYNMNLGSDSNS
jgi:hypothetical protein